MDNYYGVKMSLIRVQSLLGDLTNSAFGELTGSATNLLAWDWRLLAGGVILLIIGFFVILFLKRLIVNSVLGLIAWAILFYVVKVKLGFVASLLVSAIFGLGGIGVLLVLKFLGVQV